MCSKGKGVQQRVSPFSLLLLRSCRLPSARGGTTLGGTHSHFTKAQREREREKGPCRVRERERERGEEERRQRERETGRVLCLGLVQLYVVASLEEEEALFPRICLSRTEAHKVMATEPFIGRWKVRRGTAGSTTTTTSVILQVVKCVPDFSEASEDFDLLQG